MAFTSVIYCAYWLCALADDVSLLQTRYVADSLDVLNNSDRDAGDLVVRPYVVTAASHTCVRKFYWKDGAKIVTCKDVKIWTDGRRGIPAANSLECEGFCKEFEECTCYIFDKKRARCNLKKGCTGRKRKNKFTRGYQSCMLNRAAAKKCTAGPQGKPCRGGCVPHGMQPHCTCAAPGSICPPPGTSGDWCEKCTAGPQGKPCLNGGTATGTLPNCKCQCINQFTGDDCGTPPRCTAGPGNRACQNGGRAVGNAPNCRCQCPHSGMGTYCDNVCINCVKAGQEGHDIAERHGMTLKSCCQWAKDMGAVSINFWNGGCWPSNVGRVDMRYGQAADYCDIYRR